MEKSIFLFLVIFVLQLSCKRESGNPLEPVNSIEISAKPDDIEFDRIIKDYKYIPLETNVNGLIGKIHKIIVEDDNIFILDKDISKSVFQFNRQGDFIRLIGAKGKGPNEYLNPNDIAVNRGEKTINVYCGSTKKIFEYSFEGMHLNTIDTGLNFKSMEFINKDTIAVFVHGVYNETLNHKELPYDLLFFDKEMNLLDKQFFNNTEAGTGNTVITYNRYFTSSKNELFHNKLLHDTIYKIDGLKASPYLYIDFGDKKITKSIYAKDSEPEIFHKVADDIYRSIIRPVKVTNSNMIIEYSIGINRKNTDRNHRVLYEMDSGKYLKFSNIGSEGCTWTSPIDSYGDEFINVIYPDNFECIKDKSLNKKLSEKGLKRINNPVLLFYSFKKVSDII